MNYAPDSAHVAWAAGVFDGEGTIDCATNRLQITNTDLDLLESFQRVVGCGIIKPKKVSSTSFSKKPQWAWYVNRMAESEEILRAFYPWFCARRKAKADEFFAHLVRERKSTAGAKNGNSKLNESQVVEILLSDKIPSRLAEQYGVTVTNIISIKKRETWRSLNVDQHLQRA